MHLTNKSTHPFPHCRVSHDDTRQRPIVPWDSIRRGVKGVAVPRALTKKLRRDRMLRLAKIPPYRQVMKPCEATPTGTFSDDAGRYYTQFSNGQVRRASCCSNAVETEHFVETLR